MNFETSKTLGYIGALLIFFGTGFTFAGSMDFGLIRTAGIIFVLFSLYNLADFYNAPNIFPKRIGVAAAIFGSTLSSTYGVAILMAMLSTTILFAVLLVLVINVVFFAVAAFFVKRSLKELAVHSGTNLFSTAGQLLFIGAVLSTFILPVIIMWTTLLVLAFAFFKMKKPKPTPPSTIDISPS
ncbi:MAG: DUF996 domain-containing protein [Nitrososphaerota archaeon]|jgi:uncharacterized membrane protein|nr:DUF996 domain-containing protein [Nitrososphaerota archaeon]